MPKSSKANCSRTKALEDFGALHRVISLPIVSDRGVSASVNPFPAKILPYYGYTSIT